MPLCRDCDTLVTPEAVELTDGRCPFAGCLAPVCGFCGCTPNAACTVAAEDGTPTPCHWETPGLCSAPDCVAKALNRFAAQARAAHAEATSPFRDRPLQIEAALPLQGTLALYACALDAEGRITSAETAEGAEEIVDAAPAHYTIGEEQVTLRAIRYLRGADEPGGTERFGIEISDAAGNFLDARGLGARAGSGRPDEQPALWTVCERVPRRVAEELTMMSNVGPATVRLAAEFTVEDAARFDLIVINVERGQVESSDVTTVAARLSEMVSDREAATAFRDKVELGFEGYAEDDRELWEIPEVTSFVRALDEAFPYWTHISHPQAVMLRTVAFCLCRPEEVVRTPAGVGVRPNEDELARFLDRSLHAVDQLYRRLGIDSASLDVVAAKAAAAFNLGALRA